MENIGDYNHRCNGDRDLNIWSGVFHVDNGIGLDRPSDVAAETRKQAVAILIGYFLANHRICRCGNHEERY